jgi:hypothetical protein
MTSIDTAHTAAMTDQAHLPEHLRVDRHPRWQREGWPTIRGGKSDHRASLPPLPREPRAVATPGPGRRGKGSWSTGYGHSPRKALDETRHATWPQSPTKRRRRQAQPRNHHAVHRRPRRPSTAEHRGPDRGRCRASGVAAPGPPPQEALRSGTCRVHRRPGRRAHAGLRGHGRKAGQAGRAPRVPHLDGKVLIPRDAVERLARGQGQADGVVARIPANALSISSAAWRSEAGMK